MLAPKSLLIAISYLSRLPTGKPGGNSVGGQWHRRTGVLARVDPGSRSLHNRLTLRVMRGAVVPAGS
jgi:hypothetical protein